MTERKDVVVADLEDWVESNAATFDSVARTSGAATELVHLAAVFIKSGMTDVQIVAECGPLAARLGSSEPVEAGLRRALPLLRGELEKIADAVEEDG